MNNTAPLAYSLSLLLVFRLIFYFPDKRLILKNRFLKIAFEFVVLLPVICQWHHLFILLIVVLINTLEHLAERHFSQVYPARLTGLLLLLLSFGFFSHLNWNAWIFSLLQKLPNNFWVSQLQKADAGYFWWLCFGWLLSLNETNIFIRHLLNTLNLAPVNPEQPRQLDEQQYNRGRVIGFLERTAVYFLVFFGQYATIGLLLTAKGITRYKKLEERDFAEYFLIGTLLSTLTAGGLALIFRYLILKML
ncbi:MAG: hypothetical protein Kow0037_02980 [Calditrichia bacterium]